MAKNCWEFKNCGRDKDKSCPAVNGMGRMCWMVAGTMCGGKVQGTHAEKIGNCEKCEFFIKVNNGEL